MSHNNTIFDLLKGEDHPTAIFGETKISDDEYTDKFTHIKDEAEKRFLEMFSPKSKSLSIEVLEKTIEMMFNQSWNPETGNINLFATDFGSILCSLLKNNLGGELVFRSDFDLNNLSIWWVTKKIEVFPFHKIYKRLTSKDGEDLSYFYKQIGKLIE